MDLLCGSAETVFKFAGQQQAGKRWLLLFMDVFKIKVTALPIYSISSTFIALIGMSLGVYMAIMHVNDVYFFILILFGLAALVFIPDLLSTASTEWSITEKEIKIKWLSQFLFHKTQDQTITWDNIEEYKFQLQRRFSFFKLKLRDNISLKYWHSNSAVEDDFDAFLINFQKHVLKFNDEGINFLHGIKRSKTIYETTGGLALALILTAFMISFPILFVQLKPHKVDWIYIIAAYSGGIYFTSQVIAFRRKKKQ